MVKSYIITVNIFRTSPMSITLQKKFFKFPFKCRAMKAEDRYAIVIFRCKPGEIYILDLKDPELVFRMIRHCHTAELHRHNPSMAATLTSLK